MKRELETTSIEYSVEPKFDGLSVELMYDHGIFTRGATRGDGTTGEDVTVNLRTIRSLPLQLHTQSDLPDHLVVRGEVYMRLDDFQILNRRMTERGERCLCQSAQCGFWFASSTGFHDYRDPSVGRDLLRNHGGIHALPIDTLG